MIADYGLGSDLEQILRPRSGDSAKDLAAAVARLSDLFNGITPWHAEYGRDPLLRRAYLSYYLPTNLPKIRRPLERCWRPGAFAGRPLRVVDLGSGPGTMLLGLTDFIRNLPAAERPSALELVAVDEHSENLRDAERMLRELAAADPGVPPIDFAALRLDVVGDRRELFPLATARGRFDLAILANVVCELVRTAKRGLGDAGDLLIAVARELLKPSGMLIAIEPALRETARDLERLRDRILAETDFVALAPCVASGPCPALVRERDWCISSLPWEAPDWVTEIDRRAGLRKHELKLAYVVLGPRGEALPAGTWQVVSDVLDLKGELRIHLCGEERWIVLRHLKRHGGEIGAALESLRRGDRVAIDRLVRKGELYAVGEGGGIRKV